MSDSSGLLNGLIATLGADSALLALVPNGVYEDLAPPDATRFVIVSHIVSQDTGVFVQGRAFESTLYLVEARILASTGGDVRAAAARIDALLEDTPFPVLDYVVSAVHREEFLRGTEKDEVDPSIVWKRRGGRYRVVASPVVATKVVNVGNQGDES